jgi:hypothetical protein
VRDGQIFYYQTEAGAFPTDGSFSRFRADKRDWEEYTADAVIQGRNKALIVIGPIPSEQSGMGKCTPLEFQAQLPRKQQLRRGHILN